MNEQELKLIESLNKDYLLLADNIFFRSNPLALFKSLAMYCFKENIDNKDVDV